METLAFSDVPVLGYSFPVPLDFYENPGNNDSIKYNLENASNSKTLPLKNGKKMSYYGQVVRKSTDLKFIL